MVRGGKSLPHQYDRKTHLIDGERTEEKRTFLRLHPKLVGTPMPNEALEMAMPTPFPLGKEKFCKTGIQAIHP